MREHEEKVAKVDWQRYAEVDLHQPPGWLQMASKLTSPKLAIVCVVVVAITFRKIEWVPAAAFVSLIILGLAPQRRESDGSSSPPPTKDKTKPRYVGRDQAKA
jgi:hypothetical protein